MVPFCKSGHIYICCWGEISINLGPKVELSDNIDNAIIAIILSYRDMSLNNHDRDNLRMRRQPSARVSFSHLHAAITASLRPRNFYPWKEP